MENTQLWNGVAVVAVTKDRTPTEIQTIYEKGYRVFGENKVQQLLQKVDLYSEVKWHFIGHLQSNKIKEVIQYCSLIHSIDSISLLQKIEKESHKQNKITHVLLQLNLAKEESKFGFTIDEFYKCLQLSLNLQFVKVDGMMVIGPHTNDVCEIKKVFTEANTIFQSIQNSKPEFHILSMGMSEDYLIAIECGSTLIRLGRILY